MPGNIPKKLSSSTTAQPARGVAFRFRGMALGAFAAAASAEALALIGAFLAAPACGLAVELVEPVDEFGVELGGLLAVAVAVIENRAPQARCVRPPPAP